VPQPSRVRSRTVQLPGALRPPATNLHINVDLGYADFREHLKGDVPRTSLLTVW
jgi:hypothetical protein